MIVAVVIPCLNEQHSLPTTAKTLGFGPGLTIPPDRVLILVDNDSDDDTYKVALNIQRESSEHSVVVVSEKMRGYVPPRRRGIDVAMGLAKSRKMSIDELLIVQCDADTAYSNGYIDALSSHAVASPKNVIIEAITDYDDNFAMLNQSYIDLCRECDTLIGDVTDQPIDFIIDDKACAFWASSYLKWGEHQVEVTSQGEELHAETTRLFIRASAFGAYRILCDQAIAKHSSRRIFENPALSFATAGFPRETSFQSKFTKLYKGPSNIEDFVSLSHNPFLPFAMKCRKSHYVGLFEDLTTHVRYAIKNENDSNVALSVAGFPARDINTAKNSPGALLEDILIGIDRKVFE